MLSNTSSEAAVFNPCASQLMASLWAKSRPAHIRIDQNKFIPWRITASKWFRRMSFQQVLRLYALLGSVSLLLLSSLLHNTLQSISFKLDWCDLVLYVLTASRDENGEGPWRGRHTHRQQHLVCLIKGMVQPDWFQSGFSEKVVFGKQRTSSEPEFFK